MIRINSGDLIAVKNKNEYFYYLIRTKIKFFGGNMTYAFHRTSENILDFDDLLKGDISGFHAYIDFIEAKRSNTIVKLTKEVEFPIKTPEIVKMTPALPGNKANKWFFFSLDDEPIGETNELSEIEKHYPSQIMHPISLTYEMIKRKYKEGFDDRL